MESGLSRDSASCVQLSANAHLSRQQVMAQVAGSLWEWWREFQVPGFGLVQVQLCRHLEGGLAMRDHSVYVCAFLCLSNNRKLISFFLKKKKHSLHIS